MNFLISLFLTCVAAADNDKAVKESEATAHSDAHVHAVHDSVAAFHSDMHDAMTTGLSAPLPTDKSAVQKLMQAVGMMVSLHKTFAPVMQKLSSAMANMPEGPAKEHARELISHMSAIDTQSVKMGHLLDALTAAEGGSKEDRDVAIKNLLDGMTGCAEGIKVHMNALRELKAKYPAKHSSGQGKLEGLLVKMESNLRHDLADPAVKTSQKKAQKVKLEAMLLVLVKRAVAEQKALVNAAVQAYKEDPTPTTKEAIMVVMKKKMGELTAKLKKNMMAIELAMAKLKEEDEAGASEAKEASQEQSGASAHSEDLDEAGAEAKEASQEHGASSHHSEDLDSEEKEEASKADAEGEEQDEVAATAHDDKKSKGVDDDDDDEAEEDEGDVEDDEVEEEKQEQKKEHVHVYHAQGAEEAHGATADIDSVVGAVEGALPDAESNEAPDALTTAQLRATEVKPAGDQQLK